MMLQLRDQQIFWSSFFVRIGVSMRRDKKPLQAQLPTESFATLELPNAPNNVPELLKIPDLQALKL